MAAPAAAAIAGSMAQEAAQRPPARPGRFKADLQYDWHPLLYEGDGGVKLRTMAQARRKAKHCLPRP